MRKLVVAALGSVCLLGLAALAYATSANTTMTATASLANPNTGTKARPQGEQLNLGFTQSDPDPQPPTSVQLLIDTPPQINLKALRRWSTKRRCDSAKADQQKSDRVCPKGSKVGKVNVIAKASNGTITVNFKGVAYVIKPRGGSANTSAAAAGLGFWITTSSPVTIAQFLPGKVNHGTGVIAVSIPKNLQSVAGLKSSIEKLTAQIAGKDPRGGPLVASTGCPRSRRMNLKITSVNDDGGRVSDSGAIRCRR
jgi:hypothetical protein